MHDIYLYIFFCMTWTKSPISPFFIAGGLLRLLSRRRIEHSDNHDDSRSHFGPSRGGIGRGRCREPAMARNAVSGGRGRQTARGRSSRGCQTAESRRPKADAEAEETETSEVEDIEEGRIIIREKSPDDETRSHHPTSDEEDEEIELEDGCSKSSKKKRERSLGGPAGYHQAVIDIARRDGKNFIKYDESKLVKNTKVLPRAIAKLHDYLSCVHKYQPNLAIPRKNIEGGMKLVLNDTAKEWGIQPPLCRGVHRNFEQARNECASRRAAELHSRQAETRQSEGRQLGPRLALDGQGEGARKAEGSDAATEQ